MINNVEKVGATFDFFTPFQINSMRARMNVQYVF